MSIVKLLGAIVGAILLVFVVAGAGDLVYQASEPVETANTRGEALDEVPTVTTADVGAKEAPTQSTTEGDAIGSPASETQIAGLIGDPDAGKKVSRQCAACHTFDEGGPNRVGPNLWNVVGANVAAHDGFNYSDALKGVGGQWDLERLHAWIQDPKGFAPGNKMTFAGIKSEDDLNNLIAYLQTLQPAEEIGQMGPQGEAEGEAAAEAPADAAAPAETPAEGEAPAETQQAAATGGAVAGDPAAGEKAMRVCAACHTWDEGGGHRVGPNLFGTFGADIASHEGFKYSSALAGVEGVWTEERMDAWLKDPRAFVKGNKMTFAGVKDDTERQNIIAFLAQQR